MNQALKAKLKTLPSKPGVYFHKSLAGEVIYVGKAARLNARVRHYFQNSRLRDPKTDALVAEIVDTDWVTVESELDALFLESEMIKRYKPRYNVLLRDDKSQIYVRIPMREAYPPVTFTRGPLDDGAEYFGPYYNGWAVRKALKYLRRAFPYSIHEVMPKRVCLQYHIGLCPGVEEQKISSSEYKKTLRKLTRYLKGERVAIVRELEREMAAAAKAQKYEIAAKLRNRIHDLKELQRQIIFSDREFVDLSRDEALSGLQRLFGLKKAPRRIEGYDISHMSGTNNVASMVVATNGLADKSQYRKFTLRIPGNDDFAHMREVMSRRFSGAHDDWPQPDLLLIDGGKGQLSAALSVLREQGMTVPAIGLAKREEQIIVSQTLSCVMVDRAEVKMGYVQEEGDFLVLTLDKNHHIIKLLQRIRDESHRFAVSHHTTLKRRAATKSVLDDIPGIGPVTRKKLMMVFGSGRGVKEASLEQLSATLGQARAEIVWRSLHNDSKI